MDGWEGGRKDRSGLRVREEDNYFAFEYILFVIVSGSVGKVKCVYLMCW